MLFGSSVPLLIFFLSISIIYWEKSVELVECNCGFVYLSFGFIAFFPVSRSPIVGCITFRTVMCS